MDRGGANRLPISFHSSLDTIAPDTASGTLSDSWRRGLDSLVRSGGWPVAGRPPDLPLVAVRVDHPADLPAVLLTHRRLLHGARVDRSPLERFGIVHDEQHPAGTTADRPGTEPAHVRSGRGDPEHRVIDGQLGDDVIALTDLVQYRRAEGVAVEGDRLTGRLDPQLRLDSCHGS